MIVLNTLQYAGFWLRALAFLIDSIVIFMGSAIVAAIIGVIVKANGNDFDSGTAISLLLIFGGWFYYTIAESSERGATLGKRAAGISVVDLNAERIGFGRATARFFSKFFSAVIFYVGFMMAGFTEKRQTLHDMIVGTLVVRNK